MPSLSVVSSRPWVAIRRIAEEIAGLPRHVSQHVGGMIISSRPLVEIVPLEPAAWEGRVLCQWDKDSCEDAGFIKIDFLALGMLSLVEEAVDLIAERDKAGTGGEPVVRLSNLILREAIQQRASDIHLAPGRAVGTVGVIGPTRMDYPRVIGLVDYTARLIDEVLDTL